MKAGVQGDMTYQLNPIHNQKIKEAWIYNM